MPEWLAVIILGILEGVTEFLPVSSTGHLLIPQTLGWLPARSDLFNVVIQSGAVLAVLAVFARRVGHLATTLHQPDTRDYLLKLFVAFAVTAVGGVLIKAFDIHLPEEVEPVALATLIGGLVIFLLEHLNRGKCGSAHLTWAVVIAVGLAQVLAAAFPGTSRSGASILMALALGLSRPAATEFSFLLGVPTLMAAGAFKLASEFANGGLDREPLGLLLLGTLVSGLSAFLVVRWLIHFVQGHTFHGFAWYRVLLGTALLVYAAVR
jgi:undecaprenyl-diphosphatase